MKATEASVITRDVTAVQDSKSDKLTLTVRRTMKLTRQAVRFNKDTPARVMEGIQGTSDDNVRNVDMIFICSWTPGNNISLVRIRGMGVWESGLIHGIYNLDFRRLLQKDEVRPEFLASMLEGSRGIAHMDEITFYF